MSGKYVPKRTLREDIHRVINLDIHMVANSSQFVLLRGDYLAILALDLPRRASLLREPARNDDTLAVFLGPVGFFTLILDSYRDFRYTVACRRSKSPWILRGSTG